MTILIDIVCPTLWRHVRLPGYVQNIHDTTTGPHQISFVCEPDDEFTLAAVAEISRHDPTVRGLINNRTANTTGAFNAAVPHITAPYWFAAGDDLVYYPQWNEPLLSLALEGWQVIGTNDLHNPDVLHGKTATHFLVASRYIRERGGAMDSPPGEAGHEGYEHNFFDTELVLTAKERGVWIPCLASQVEHKHWVFGQSGIDRTYERTVGSEGPDRELWAQRRLLLKVPEL